jgi:hypothetical protein
VTSTPRRFERVDGAGPHPVDVAVLIVVRAKVAVILPRGQDVVDSAQQGRRHGDYRERKEMSSRQVVSDLPVGDPLSLRRSSRGTWPHSHQP